MKKKISLPIVIAIVLIVSALVFSLAYMMATKAMNKKLKDLGEKQSMFSTLADVDRFVRENSDYPIDEENLRECYIHGYADAFDGRVLHLSAEEYKDSTYAQAGYKVMTIADGCVIVVLTEDQYLELNPEVTEPVTAEPSEEASAE